MGILYEYYYVYEWIRCLIIVPIDWFVWSLHISFPLAYNRILFLKLFETFNKFVCSFLLLIRCMFFFSSFILLLFFLFLHFASVRLLLEAWYKYAPIRERYLFMSEFWCDLVSANMKMCSKRCCVVWGF